MPEAALLSRKLLEAPTSSGSPVLADSSMASTVVFRMTVLVEGSKVLVGAGGGGAGCSEIGGGWTAVVLWLGCAVVELVSLAEVTEDVCEAEVVDDVDEELWDADVEERVVDDDVEDSVVLVDVSGRSVEDSWRLSQNR